MVTVTPEGVLVAFVMAVILIVVFVAASGEKKGKESFSYGGLGKPIMVTFPGTDPRKGKVAQYEPDTFCYPQIKRGELEVFYCPRKPSPIMPAQHYWVPRASPHASRCPDQVSMLSKFF